MARETKGKASKKSIARHKEAVEALTGDAEYYAKTLKLGRTALRRFLESHANGTLDDHAGFQEWVEDRDAKFAAQKQQNEIDSWGSKLSNDFSRPKGRLLESHISRAIKKLSDSITGSPPGGRVKVLNDAANALRKDGYANRAGKAMYNGMDVVEALHPRNIRVREIQNILPDFDPGYKTYSQLGQDLAIARRMSDNVNTILESPEFAGRGDELLSELYKKNPTPAAFERAVNKEVARVLGMYTLQDVKTGAHPLGQFLTPEQLEEAKGRPGSNVRGDIENAGTKVRRDYSKLTREWNKSVMEQAESLLKQGFFGDNGQSDTRRPPQWSNIYEADVGRELESLSLRDKWVAERILEYGHLGSASNPAFYFAVNDPSNAGPEFALWNHQTSAGMTPHEFNVASARIGSGSGFTWDETNLDRFLKYLDEVTEVPESVIGELIDLVNEGDGIRAGTDGSISTDQQRKAAEILRKHGHSPDQHLLTDDKNRFTLDHETLGYPTSEQDAAIARRLAYMGALPNIDMNAALKVGVLGDKNLARYSRQELQKLYEEIKQLDPKDIAEYKENVLKLQAEEGITVDQSLRKARLLSSGRIPITLVAALSMVGQAMSDSPDDETKVEAMFRGLENYDKAITQPGAEAIMGIADKAGVGDAMRSADEAVTDRIDNAPRWAWGPLGEVKQAATRLVYDALKYIPAEIIGMGIQGVAGKETSTEADVPQVYPPLLNPQHDYSLDAVKKSLPENVMELYQEATPWKKYGGALQNRYP